MEQVLDPILEAMDQVLITDHPTMDHQIQTVTVHLAQVLPTMVLGLPTTALGHQALGQVPLIMDLAQDQVMALAPIMEAPITVQDLTMVIPALAMAATLTETVIPVTTTETITTVASLIVPEMR